MKRLLLPLAFVLLAGGTWAQQDTLKYRILLRDKAATEYSLQRPEDFLSKKALLPVDSTDLPVCRKYVDEIARQGLRVVVTGKWENFVTVSCNDSTLMDKVAALPFVRSVERVWRAPRSAKEVAADRRDSLINQPTTSLKFAKITIFLFHPTPANKMFQL